MYYYLGYLHFKICINSTDLMCLLPLLSAIARSPSNELYFSYIVKQKQKLIHVKIKSCLFFPLDYEFLD